MLSSALARGFDFSNYSIIGTNVELVVCPAPIFPSSHEASSS